LCDFNCDIFLGAHVYIVHVENYNCRNVLLTNITTRHILLSNGANCTVLHAVVLTQYQRVTDGQTDGRTDRQTDGIAVANTALAMRALRAL